MSYSKKQFFSPKMINTMYAKDFFLILGPKPHPPVLIKHGIRLVWSMLCIILWLKSARITNNNFIILVPEKQNRACMYFDLQQSPRCHFTYVKFFFYILTLVSTASVALTSNFKHCCLATDLDLQNFFVDSSFPDNN